MKQKTYKWTKKEKDIIRKMVKEAQEVLNLQSWLIKQTFFDGEIEAKESYDNNLFVADADSASMADYEKIAINWYPATLKKILEKDYVGYKDIVFHEVVHGLTSELYNLTLTRFTMKEECVIANERLTQRIARIVCMLTTHTKK